MKATLKGLVIILILAVFVLSGCTSDSSSGGSTGSTGSTGDTGTTGSTGLPGSTGSTGDDAVDTGPIGAVEGTGDPRSIEFVTATPENIALKGAGGAGRPETSVVVFKVLDDNGGYLSNVTVNFSLSSSVGGLELTPTSSVTNSEGLAGTYVTAGNVATSIRVLATVTVGTDTMSTMSSSLVVSTGIADKNSFSLSQEVCSIQGWSHDKETVGFTIMAADHFNNPVPDDTAIYFTTEGGAIEPYCLTIDGECSVTWKSQEPRPEGGGNELRDGRATILAMVIGEESFIDTDGNGLFDSADDVDYWDPSNDLPEAFLDIDEEGVHDDFYEEFWDFNVNGDYDLANGMYNGILCSGSAETNGDCTKDSLVVSESAVLIMATDEANATVTISGTVATFTVSDGHGNSMPTDSTIAVTACSTATLDYLENDSIPCTTEPFTFDAVFETGDTPCGTLTITTPKRTHSWNF